MDRPIENYWNLKMDVVQGALEDNNFEVFRAKNAQDAARVVLEEIMPATGAKSVSWGGSLTVVASGLYDTLLKRDDLDIIDTWDKKISDEEKNERRRQALLADLFITGTNALTESGYLVNLDMIGNRVGAITYGPKNVVILVSRNKIVPDLPSAMERIKDYAAPVNTMRLDMKTPCRKTGTCHDCDSPKRICNVWTIQEKSFPPKRIKVVLIDEELGF